MPVAISSLPALRMTWRAAISCSTRASSTAAAASPPAEWLMDPSRRSEAMHRRQRGCSPVAVALFRPKAAAGRSAPLHTRPTQTGIGTKHTPRIAFDRKSGGC